MKAPIGIGFLSFAHGHVGAYVDVMKHFDDVKLIAAYDDDERRGKDVCESAGMKYSPHVEDVLNDPKVRAVIVGSETNRHAELCVAAAQAGKHILCQKPMALTLDDCDRMINAADKAGISLGIAYQMRHDPANIKMWEIVQSGELGPICAVRRRHCIGVLLMDSFINGPTHWHIEAEKNRGMFMDDASHPADWFYWMLGKPVSVMAEIGNVITNVAPDDNGAAIFRFSHGEMGLLFNSSTVMVSENTTEIYGVNGCVIQNYGDGPSCGVPRCPDGPAVKMFKYGEANWRDMGVPIPANHGVRIQAVPRPWVDSLINETPPAVTGRDGKVSVAMVLGAYQSAQEGRRVTFSW
jgi:predicted dehydrogenase